MAREGQIDWFPDSRRLVYASERDGTPRLFLFDFADNSEVALTTPAATVSRSAAVPGFGDSSPQVSPDGKTLLLTATA